MCRYWLRLLIIYLVLTIFWGDNVYTEAAQTKAVPPRNVVLIGWDGAQRKHIKECLAREELPNIKKLSSEGALVAIDIIRMTQTKPGWAQILTGYEPEVTGVFSNDRYQPIEFNRCEGLFGCHGDLVELNGFKRVLLNVSVPVEPVPEWKKV